MKLLSASIKEQDAGFASATATVSVLSEGASQCQPSQQPCEVSSIQKPFLLTHSSPERNSKQDLCCKIK